ncbi:glutamine--tRNA ligase/YqeY domain fusion protein [Flavobacteriaceae bacterium]|jgi:glutaminyl-tRNA synthetase|nr:glutamine--tRNA ligase/YqeY domain fusion protein [Flavobacteriaceae bacterium]MDC1051653.1 glutamine--tRNA ligase/YqeY domain fusion protein [Flavobacteriaceae bacterium]
MSEDVKALNFIEHIIEEDLGSSLQKSQLRFRFPPEPNGYLHIGHTKAIGISFGLGEKYNAPVNLRFDDTNPIKEEQEYVDAIKRDILWLGYHWENEVYSSDYFTQLFEWAVKMIKEGKAYVDSQSSEDMASQKGTPTQVGYNSPFRSRSVDENLDLFNRMKDGEFSSGEHVLRAKINMEDPNMLMRDPIMYRVMHARHHRTGSDWCIYPMYDWTHGESDYIEQISHSLCSLEFKPHRKLYDWFKDQVYQYSQDTLPLIPKQREFARLNLSYTIMSKRKLLRLVDNNIVTGWDDPRMPTISGLRRRGYTPKAIRSFIDKVGVAKRENIIDVSLLEFCIREDLNKVAPRVMGVLNPIKIIITNYPEDREEWLEAENNPENIDAGTRKVPFSREIFIEKEDFKESAGNKFFRLKIGSEVRLKNAYIIKANSVLKTSTGEIEEVHCTYTKDTEKRVKGTLHWVSIKHALKVEVRDYDRLFLHEAPDNQGDRSFMDFINPESLKIIQGYVEPSLKNAQPEERFQFQRLGYFNIDKDSDTERLVFNKIVGLRDSWIKKQAASNKNQSFAPPLNNQQPKAINVLQKLGKKYTKQSKEKQLLIKDEVKTLTQDIQYSDLEALFNTSVKKVGTRIVVMISLQEMLNKGLTRNQLINDFISKALNDNNDLLVAEAKNF